MFGKGFTDAVPGSARGTFLVVDDIEAARAQLLGQGVNVTDVFHFENHLLRVFETNGRLPGLDPNRDSYFSFGSFSDPDGNTWLLQEVRARLPGRGFSLDVATMTTLLREAETHHGEYESSAPKHHWSEWYAAYLVARGTGRTVEDAAAEGARRIERALVPA